MERDGHGGDKTRDQHKGQPTSLQQSTHDAKEWALKLAKGLPQAAADTLENGLPPHPFFGAAVESQHQSSSAYGAGPCSGSLDTRRLKTLARMHKARAQFEGEVEGCLAGAVRAA